MNPFASALPKPCRRGCALLALATALVCPALPAQEQADSTYIPSTGTEPLKELRSPLLFRDGRLVTKAEQWPARRAEILAEWQQLMGAWPPVLERPRVEVLETSQREGITQRKVRVEIAPGQTGEGYLLVPPGQGKHPAVFVPYYEPETSVGLGQQPLRDYAWQLAREGFVALAIGSPGGDARKPVLCQGAQCQPLSYLGYVAANGWQTLAAMPEVDASRIGIVGHSYGGKWAMFGACLWEKYACGVWSDPGIVFDETRHSINYQEPWYLGLDPSHTRKPGLVTTANPRTGAYQAMIAQGLNLHEFQSLMCPRPFLVSGGEEDPPKRWGVLGHVMAVNKLLTPEPRVFMTNRPKHPPTEAANAAVVAFFKRWLKR